MAQGLVSKYDSTCPRCSKPIVKDVDRITRRDGQWTHIKCEPTAQVKAAIAEKVASTPRTGADALEVGVYALNGKRYVLKSNLDGTHNYANEVQEYVTKKGEPRVKIAYVRGIASELKAEHRIPGDTKAVLASMLEARKAKPQETSTLPVPVVAPSTEPVVRMTPQEIKERMRALKEKHTAQPVTPAAPAASLTDLAAAIAA